MITSPHNPRVKYLRKLHDRNVRAREGRCWAESRRCVEVALASSWPVEEVAISAEAAPDARTLAARAAAQGCPVLECSSSCFRKFSALRHSDGIGAVVRTRVNHGLPPEPLALTVVAWQLQDPGNLGSIIRSAVAMHCRRLVAVIPTVDPTHPLCIRASAGMIFLIDVWLAPEADAYAWLHHHASQSAALAASGSLLLDTAALNPPRILVLGNEARGLPTDLMTSLPSISIPMAPDVESLNVNAAAAIAMYALWCQPPSSNTRIPTPS